MSRAVSSGQMKGWKWKLSQGKEYIRGKRMEEKGRRGWRGGEEEERGVEVEVEEEIKEDGEVKIGEEEEEIKKSKEE